MDHERRREARQKPFDERALADARLAGDEHEPSRAGRRGVERRAQRGQLLPPARRGVGRGDRVDGRRVEPAVLREDGLLERPEARRRADPELLVELGPQRVVGGERLALAPGSVEREHQLAAQALAQRMARDQQLELADEVGGAAECEVGLDAVLERGELQLLQARALDARERLGGELGQRRAAPERECRPEALGSGGRVGLSERRPPRAGELLEAAQVERVGGPELETVARRARLQELRGQRLAQPRDIDLHHLDGGVGQLVAPQVIHEPLDRHRPAGVEQQAREQRTLLSRAECERLPPVARLERAEDTEVHAADHTRLPFATHLPRFNHEPVTSRP